MSLVTGAVSSNSVVITGDKMLVQTVNPSYKDGKVTPEYIKVVSREKSKVFQITDKVVFGFVGGELLGAPIVEGLQELAAEDDIETAVHVLRVIVDELKRVARESSGDEPYFNELRPVIDEVAPRFQGVLLGFDHDGNTKGYTYYSGTDEDIYEGIAVGNLSHVFCNGLGTHDMYDEIAFDFGEKEASTLDVTQRMHQIHSLLSYANPLDITDDYERIVLVRKADGEIESIHTGSINCAEQHVALAAQGDDLSEFTEPRICPHYE
ncbi:hypothetical protein [Shouchella miscanthi]|uniref:Uncharacterized protein n=1 Tax=Shouchella miscanthi TaxID=2598861 RepID=A0ABU6NRS6_9BACI|nr:hypothetical protein [Shouchella miscanthi]